MGSHYGIAPSGGMAPFSKLPNTAAFCGLCGRDYDDSGFGLYQTESRSTIPPNSESL
jgi:hypothetical protein